MVNLRLAFAVIINICASGLYLILFGIKVTIPLCAPANSIKCLSHVCKDIRAIRSGILSDAGCILYDYPVCLRNAQLLSLKFDDCDAVAAFAWTAEIVLGYVRKAFAEVLDFSAQYALSAPVDHSYYVVAGAVCLV